MRIAFVTDTYDGISGGTVSGRRFVEALRANHDVTVVATDPPAPGKVQVPRLPIPSRAMRDNRFTFGWPKQSVLEEAFSGVDLVHVQFPFYLGSGATKLAIEKGIPLVAAFHVQPQNLLYDIKMRSERAADWLYRSWIRNVFEPADAVIVPTPFASQRLQYHGLTTPTWPISNGVRLRPQHCSERSGPPYLLLAVGRLAAEKRQDVIIDAVARSRHRDQIQLVIAGAGPLERRLSTRARRRGLSVEIGYVSDDRLVRLYDEATLLIHASEVELEGMAVLDAMGACLPALIADAPESASAALAADSDFLFRPGNASDLADHLDYLLDDPDVRAAGARRGVELADQHDFQGSVSTLEHLYESVLTKGRTGPTSPVDGFA
jgi:1,2-diacylglycerol 3-alpha-glucosyltransferase